MIEKYTRVVKEAVEMNDIPSKYMMHKSNLVADLIQLQFQFLPEKFVKSS